MPIKSFLGVLTIVLAAGFALSQASMSQARSLDEAVTAGGMGAQIDGFRAFVLPGVMPVALIDSDSRRSDSDVDRMVAADADGRQLDDGLSTFGSWETRGN
jgi:hypothetical protein